MDKKNPKNIKKRCLWAAPHLDPRPNLTFAGLDQGSLADVICSWTCVMEAHCTLVSRHATPRLGPECRP